VKKIQILTLSAFTAPETDAAKSGSNVQNATSGAMKSVRVQMTGKRSFSFSATLNNRSARLP
jgi:hypothetical protein